MNRRAFVGALPIAGVMLVGGITKLGGEEWYPPPIDSILCLNRYAGRWNDVYRQAIQEAHKRGWRYSIGVESGQTYKGKSNLYSLYWKLMKPGDAYSSHGSIFFLSMLGGGVLEDSLRICHYQALDTLLRLQKSGKL